MLGNTSKLQSTKCGCSLVEIYSAAKFLGIEELVEYCWKVTSDVNMSGCRAFALFLEAYTWDIPTFKSVMISRVGDFFLNVVASKEFVELDLHSVRELLSMNSVGVNSEIEVRSSEASHDFGILQSDLLDIHVWSAVAQP